MHHHVNNNVIDDENTDWVANVEGLQNFRVLGGVTVVNTQLVTA